MACGLPRRCASGGAGQHRNSLNIRPEDVRILYPDRPLADAVRDNLVTGRIVTSRPHPGGRVLHLALPNLHEIEVRHAATTYAPLGLQVGDEVRLSLRRDALVVISR